MDKCWKVVIKEREEQKKNEKFEKEKKLQIAIYYLEKSRELYFKAMGTLADIAAANDAEPIDEGVEGAQPVDEGTAFEQDLQDYPPMTRSQQYTGADLYEVDPISGDVSKN